jgi:hypothetical protein
VEYRLQLDSLVSTHTADHSITQFRLAPFLLERKYFARCKISIIDWHCLALLRKTAKMCKIIGIPTEKPTDYKWEEFTSSTITLHWSRSCDFRLQFLKSIIFRSSFAESSHLIGLSAYSSHTLWSMNGLAPAFYTGVLTISTFLLWSPSSFLVHYTVYTVQD